jgi:hypothetical protein
VITTHKGGGRMFSCTRRLILPGTAISGSAELRMETWGPKPSRQGGNPCVFQLASVSYWF